MRKRLFAAPVFLALLVLPPLLCCGTPSLRTPGPTVTRGPTPTISSLTYADIDAAHDRMTTVQWESYVLTLPGTRIRWRGEVTQVSKDGRVTLDLPSATFSFCYLEGLPYDLAVSLNKGDVLVFEATICKVEHFLGMMVTLCDPRLISRN